MNAPVRVLSDLHLAHKVSRVREVEALRPLIRGAGTVIFNGDTWQELANRIWPRSLAMLEDLRRICAEENCEPLFLPGNHDPGWPGRGWVELAEGRIVITHGDAIFPSGSPWKREVITGADVIAALWENHPRAADDAAERIRLAQIIARELRSLRLPEGSRIWQRAWDAVMPPRRAFHMLDSWRTQGSAAAAFARRYFPRAQVIVIGHFHVHGTWLEDGVRVINTGSFLDPGAAHWVEWRDGWLARGIVDESGGVCRKGRTLGVWRL